MEDKAHTDGTSSEEVTNSSSEVHFPRAKPNIPPMKLGSLDEVEDDTNSARMWQVYILGGFMIVRWFYSRWKERSRGRRFAGDQ